LAPVETIDGSSELVENSEGASCLQEFG